MIIIILKNTAEMLIALLAVKGIATFLTDKDMKTLDRFGVNLFEWSKTTAILWLLLTEVLLIQTWGESVSFYKKAGTPLAAGFAVIIMWIWSIVICLIAPGLAGLKKLWRFGTTSLMGVLAGITVLTLL